MEDILWSVYKDQFYLQQINILHFETKIVEDADIQVLPWVTYLFLEITTK